MSNEHLKRLNKEIVGSKAKMRGQGPERGIAVGDFSTRLQTTVGLLTAAQGQHKARQGIKNTKRKQNKKKEERMKRKNRQRRKL